MEFLFLFLKSKGHEKENTGILRKEISDPCICPSRDKRKHNQKAQVTPRTTQNSALWSCPPQGPVPHLPGMGIESLGGVCDFRTSAEKNAHWSRAHPLPLQLWKLKAVMLTELFQISTKPESCCYTVIFVTSQKSPQPKNSKIEISFCKLYPFDFLHSLK